MVSKEEEARLRSDFSAASTRLKSGKVGGSNGLESAYAKAYQRLVAAGLEMQLRKKYRAP